MIELPIKRKIFIVFLKAINKYSLIYKQMFYEKCIIYRCSCWFIKKYVKYLLKNKIKIILKNIIEYISQK
jgi:hypothetical protein